MIIKTKTIIDIEINKITDLKKLKYFMDNNGLKINKTQIARNLGVDPRTVDKYLNGYEKPTIRNKKSSIDSYYETIKELLSMIPLRVVKIEIDVRSSKQYMKQTATYLRREINSDKASIGTSEKGLKENENPKDKAFPISILATIETTNSSTDAITKFCASISL